MEFEMLGHPIILSQMIKVRLHNFMHKIGLSIVKHTKGGLCLGFLKRGVKACECLYLIFLLMTCIYCQRRHCDQNFGISIISVLPLFVQGEYNTHHAVLVNGI